MGHRLEMKTIPRSFPGQRICPVCKMHGIRLVFCLSAVKKCSLHKRVEGEISFSRRSALLIRAIQIWRSFQSAGTRWNFNEESFGSRRLLHLGAQQASCDGMSRRPYPKNVLHSCPHDDVDEDAWVCDTTKNCPPPIKFWREFIHFDDVICKNVYATRFSSVA